MQVPNFVKTKTFLVLAGAAVLAVASSVFGFDAGALLDSIASLSAKLGTLGSEVTPAQ